MVKNAAPYVESKHILGESLGFGVLPRFLSYLEVQNNLVTLCKTIWLLETQGDFNRGLQLELIKTFFPVNLQERAKELILRGNIIFFVPQLMISVKYLLMYGKHENTKTILDDDDKNKLALSLLAVTDEITRNYKKQKKTLSKDASLTRIANEVISTAYLTKTPNIWTALTRTTHLYVNLHNAYSSEMPKDYLDLNLDFKKATGIFLDDYLVLGLAVLTKYIKHFGHSNVADLPDFIYFMPDLFFETTQLDKETINKFIDFISAPIEDLGKNISKQNSRERTHDFLLFKWKPLLKLNDELYMPISINYFVEKITMGVYWILFGYYKTQDDSKALQFSRYNGQIFEKYVADVITQLHKRNPPSSSIEYDQKYYIGKEQLRTPDVMIFCDDYAIFVEASATRLQAKQTISMGNIDAFEKDNEKIVFHNASSLDVFINNFLDKKTIIENIDASKIKRIYPVVVAIEGYPKLNVLYLFIQEELDKRLLFQSERVQPFSLLDVSDLEYLEGFSDLMFVDALDKWHAHPNFKDDSLDGILQAEYPDAKNNSKWLKAISDDLFDKATRAIFNKPLKEILIDENIDKENI